jgi:hypothetical protein
MTRNSMERINSLIQLLEDYQRNKTSRIMN